MIESLAKPLAPCRAILDLAAKEAEQALTHLCRTACAVGFWNGQPVPYPYLTPPAELPVGAAISQLGWTPAQIAAAGQLESMATSIRRRLKGYAGWLLTEPAYGDDVRDLAAEWEQLPAGERPTFPLSRALPLQIAPAQAEPASPALTAFADKLRTFLDRWLLQGLATWDLPLPHGPLLPNDLPPGSPALPACGLHIFLPLHYRLQGDDGLHRQILQQQQQLVRKLGLDPSLAGLRHYRAYGQMLDVIHWEQALVRRYGRSRRPQNFMTQVEAALEKALRVRNERIKKLRKAIACCRRGQRSAVQW
jgi:hypothetical protein